MSAARTLTAEEIDAWLRDDYDTPPNVTHATIAAQAKRVPELERACELARDFLREAAMDIPYDMPAEMLAALAAVGMKP